MQPVTFTSLASAMLLLALGNQTLFSNETNPYGGIVDRNPFGLKPPPPPPPAPDTAPPPVPMAQVTLTGLLSTFGEPRALLEIIEEPGKGGGTPKRPPPMREGERLGPVEILAIDVVKNMVRIRNSTVETNITFAVVKSTPTPGGSGVPAAPAHSYTPPPLSAAVAVPASGGPTVISQNGATPGGGVSLFGGGGVNGGAATPMSTGHGVTSFGGSSGAGYPSASASSYPAALGAQNAGSPVIPPRPLRTDVASADSMPPMTRDQAALLIEANRLRNQGTGAPPLPPTHLTPIVQGDDGPPQQPPSPFPKFPQRLPPPVPGR